MSEPSQDPQENHAGPVPTDAELLRRAQAGDALSVRGIYERYLAVVWRFAYAQLSGDHHEAEDLTAETFLAAVRSFHRLDAGTILLGGWLIGIARHKLADRRRTANRKHRLLQIVQARTALMSEADGEAALLQDENRAAVARIMNSLPDDERLVLEWKYLDELAVREISQRLGRTEKAVEGLLFRARRNFRDCWNNRRERK